MAGLISDLKRHHRIRATLEGELAQVPSKVARLVSIAHDEATKRITIETEDGLKDILSWLATLPIAEVEIEPLGLRAVYEQYHAVGQGADDE